MDLDEAMSQASSPRASNDSLVPEDVPTQATYDIDEPAIEPLLRNRPPTQVYKSRASESILMPYNLRRAPLRRPSPALMHSCEDCTLRAPSPETTIDDYLLDNWLDPPMFRPTPPVPSEYDPSGTPLPATPLCNTPEPDEMPLDFDPGENHRFFANLYEDARSDMGDDENFGFEFGHEEFEGREDVGEDAEQFAEEEGAEVDGDDEQDMEDNEQGLFANAEAGPGDEGAEIQDLDNNDDDNEDPNEDESAAAFQEHPILRNIYLRTYIDLVFHHATKEQIQKNLASHKLALEAAAQVGELPRDLLEGLIKMPLTIRSLERRLGMDTTWSICIYTLCEGCGTRYSPEQIKLAQHPRCTHLIGGDTCNTALYTNVTLCDGTRKRNPIRSCPYIPLGGSVEHVLLRPGMKEMMQEWRRGDPNNCAEDMAPRDRDYWGEHAPEKIWRY
ncbi:hypothetical protein RSOL_479490, partial [Rhizoctonia solani AG-3 Rhs1AP]